MQEIKKLDDKYLVIKKDDLDKYFSQFTRGIFTSKKEQNFIDKIPFKKVLTDVDIQRHQEGKKDNHYVVLNLDDEIDLEHFCNALRLDKYWEKDGIVKVKDVAVDLVNAILKAKGD